MTDWNQLVRQSVEEFKPSPPPPAPQTVRVPIRQKKNRRLGNLVYFGMVIHAFFLLAWIFSRDEDWLLMVGVWPIAYGLFLIKKSNE